MTLSSPCMKLTLIRRTEAAVLAHLPTCGVSAASSGKTGRTFVDYLNDVRLGEACPLADRKGTSLSVTGGLLRLRLRPTSRTSTAISACGTARRPGNIAAGTSEAPPPRSLRQPPRKIRSAPPLEDPTLFEWISDASVARFRWPSRAFTDDLIEAHQQAGLLGIVQTGPFINTDRAFADTGAHIAPRASNPLRASQSPSTARNCRCVSACPIPGVRTAQVPLS